MNWLLFIVHLKLRFNKYKAEKQKTRCLFTIKRAIIQIKINVFNTWLIMIFWTSQAIIHEI